MIILFIAFQKAIICILRIKMSTDVRFSGPDLVSYELNDLLKLPREPDSVGT